MIGNGEGYARPKRIKNLGHISIKHAKVRYGMDIDVLIYQVKVHVLKAAWLTTRTTKQKITVTTTK